MTDTARVLERFLALTNSRGSPVFELFADSVEWREMHSGRAGGRDALFAAMHESRAMFDDMRFDKRALVVEGELAALEGDWSGRMTTNGAQVSAPTIYMFRVRDGKIVAESDYVIMPS